MKGACSMDAAFDSEAAEARRKRIECRNRAGRFLDSNGDMKWLYFDLALRGALENNEQTLKELVQRLHWENAAIDEIVEQAARYIDQPLLHCTGLRDLFIVRLVEGLIVFVRDAIRDRLVIFFRSVMAVLLLLLALVLYALVNWWVAAGIFFLLIAKLAIWLRDPANMQRCTIRNHATRERIKEFVSVLQRGGFDEPTIIRQLEALDNKVPPLPKLIYIYNCPYFLGSDPSGIQEHSIPIPDVLYALLRIPRRNPQGEISAKIFALSERKPSELARGWRKLVDPMLSYDEPQTVRE
jgi:ABC-type multidrug transport system fused ATPase/permease subunit